MSKATSSITHPNKRRWLYFACLAMLALIVAATTRFDIKGNFEGLFLLKGGKGALFEVKDDVLLGDGSRIIYGVNFDEYRILGWLNRHKPGEPYLYFEWDDKDGDGYVRNILPDGTQLLTCLGRFDEFGQKHERGLFVGGGLPENVREDNAVKMNETGMAFYDGLRWYHIWCSVNEGIASCFTGEKVTPYRWKFLGSRVINSSEKSLALSSSHETAIDGVPLRIDRYAYFTAGKTYFTLSIRITNVGSRPACYYYCYGDEPWVGNFGSSKGNVGWTGDGVIDYAQRVDTQRNNYAGIFDYGNDAIAEGHNFTGKADFIEWLGPTRPDTAYFSNGPSDIPRDGAAKAPLASNQRFIGLEWGPRELKPGQTENYILAIGMAGLDPKTGLPVKPDTSLR